ncbi:hypothetical protein QE152_g40600 [Popillia japonica]|uniref:Uncharacterized protein n=1 Tax=Popillia japonica TaxID=7064 RepID=A0AAW1HFN5_POPJA
MTDATHTTHTQTQLKTLRYKRGALKTQLTLFQKYLNGLDKSQLTETDKQNLKLRTTKIESIYDNFQNIQIEIELINVEEDVDPLPEDCERESFANLYFELLGLASAILSNDKQDIQSDISTDSAVLPQSLPNLHKVHVKLPTISLPTFDGSFTLWREFFDAFTDNQFTDF